jgi:Glycosyltransferase family 87
VIRRGPTLASSAGGESGEDSTSPLRGLVVPIVGGFAAVVLICLGATLAGPPFDVHVPGAWLFGMARITSEDRVVGAAVVFTGLAGVIVAWYLIILYLRSRPSTPVRTLLVVFALWAVPLLIAPPLFSQDVYSYVAQGTMVSTGINPYSNGPVALEFSDPQVVSMVDPIWQTTPVPYGPLFLGFEAAAVISAHHNEVAAVEGLRILALAGVLLAAGCVVLLARKSRTSPALAVALAILNPLTLLGLLSPGHNDALMAGLILCALVLLGRGRPALAVTVCALAAAVKSPALIATAFVTWEWAGARDSWRARLRAVAASCAVTVVTFEVLGLLTRVGWGWIRTGGTPGLVRSVLTPTTDVAVLAGDLVRILQFGPSGSALLSASRLLGYLAAGAAIGWLLWHSRRLGMGLALAISLLVVVALGPIYQPWYLAWGLFCLAPVATGRWRLLLIATSTYATISLLPRFEPFVGSTGLAGDAFGIVVAIGLAALALPRVAGAVTSVAERLFPTTVPLAWSGEGRSAVGRRRQVRFEDNGLAHRAGRRSFEPDTGEDVEATSA